MADLIPIIIANPRPFRLILRNPEDALGCTADEVNSRSYNWLKLHRSSAFIDVGLPRPYTMALGFDGSFILPAIPAFRTIDATVEEFNRVFACLRLGGLPVDAVQPTDLSQGHMSLHGYFRHTQPIGERGRFHMALGTRGVGHEAICLVEPPTALTQEIQAAYLEGAPVINALHTLSPTILISAFTFYSALSLRESLVNAWIAIEQLVEVLWKSFVVDPAKSSSVPRRTAFLTSQQWRVAHKLELLFDKGKIEEDVYSLLRDASSARNNLAHRGERPSRETCVGALRALVALIKIAAGAHGVEVKLTHLMDSIESPNSDANPRSVYAVTKANEIDSSKASYWRSIQPIPGEERWEGEFESFEDITLIPIADKPE